MKAVGYQQSLPATDPQALVDIELPDPVASGQDILVSMALKPTSSISIPGKTINTAGEVVDVVTKGRHDPCVGIRAVPIAEAMLAIVLMDHYLRHRAQNINVQVSTPDIARLGRK